MDTTRIKLNFYGKCYTQCAKQGAYIYCHKFVSGNIKAARKMLVKFTLDQYCKAFN